MVSFRPFRLLSSLVLLAAFACVGCSESSIPGPRGPSESRAQEEEALTKKTITIDRIRSEQRGQIRYVVYYIYSKEIPETVLVGAPGYGKDCKALPILEEGDRVSVEYKPGGSLESIKLVPKAE